MSEVHKHRPIPSDLKPPVYHNSGGKTSTPAGGEVSRDQFHSQPLPVKNGGEGKE
jgi:hypothetical protein